MATRSTQQLNLKELGFLLQRVEKGIKCYQELTKIVLILTVRKCHRVKIIQVFLLTVKRLKISSFLQRWIILLFGAVQELNRQALSTSSAATMWKRSAAAAAAAGARKTIYLEITPIHLSFWWALRNWLVALWEETLMVPKKNTHWFIPFKSRGCCCCKRGTRKEQQEEKQSNKMLFAAAADTHTYVLTHSAMEVCNFLNDWRNLPG